MERCRRRRAVEWWGTRSTCTLPETRGTYKAVSDWSKVVVNGRVAASSRWPQTERSTILELVSRSRKASWVAVPTIPTTAHNPVNVIIDNQPIRASRESALWCAESVRLLWHNRRRFISETEQPAAKIAYTNALEKFFRIAGRIRC